MIPVRTIYQIYSIVTLLISFGVTVLPVNQPPFPLHVLVAMPYHLGSVHDNPFQLTIDSVKPVLELAKDEIFEKQQILPNNSLHLHFADSNASDTFGPWRAVEALAKNELDVVLGYANTYAMVPVARMSWLFKNSLGVPVITSIGQVDQLDNRVEYKLLTRMSGSYRELAKSVKTYFNKTGWNLHAYIIHNHIKHKQYGRTECFHQLSAIRSLEIEVLDKAYKSPYYKEFDPAFTHTSYLHLVQEVSLLANSKISFMYSYILSGILF